VGVVFRHGRQEHSELLREHFGSTRALIECGAANNARLKTIRFHLVRGLGLILSTPDLKVARQSLKPGFA
jgi:hypothetical protein